MPDILPEMAASGMGWNRERGLAYNARAVSRQSE